MFAACRLRFLAPSATWSLPSTFQLTDPDVTESRPAPELRILSLMRWSRVSVLSTYGVLKARQWCVGFPKGGTWLRTPAFASPRGRAVEASASHCSMLAVLFGVLVHADLPVHCLRHAVPRAPL